MLVAWLAATIVVIPAAALANGIWDRGFTVVLVAWCTYGLSASGLVFMRPRSAWLHLAVVASIACASAVALGIVLAAFD